MNSVSLAWCVWCVADIVCVVCRWSGVCGASLAWCVWCVNDIEKVYINFFYSSNVIFHSCDNLVVMIERSNWMNRKSWCKLLNTEWDFGTCWYESYWYTILLHHGLTLIMFHCNTWYFYILVIFWIMLNCQWEATWCGKLTLYVAVTQFTIGKLRHCYVKSFNISRVVNMVLNKQSYHIVHSEGNTSAFQFILKTCFLSTDSS